MNLFVTALEGLDLTIEYNKCEIPLEFANLDVDKINQLKEYPDLINKMADWIKAPDVTLINSLRELAKLIYSIYKDDPIIGMDPMNSFKAYRGFDINSPYQNTLGLSVVGENSIFITPFEEGHVFSYGSEDRALSLTTSLDPVAKEFGSTIVEVNLCSASEDLLFVTDELCYLVATMSNNKKLFTQKEVILLPSYTKEFKVIQK